MLFTHNFGISKTKSHELYSISIQYSITIYMWTWTNKDHRDLLAYLPLFVIPMLFVCTRQHNWKKFWKQIPLLDSVRIFKRRQNDDAVLLNLSEDRESMELYSSYEKE